jgi:hypothetical protein
MNRACANCALVFEREQGFFLMSIYMAYGLDMLLLAPIVVTAMLQGRSIWSILLVSLLTLALISPFTLRFTRSFWIHLDYWMDPPK